MKSIILSGGSGTRLWPLSRKLMPKQFLKLFNNKSLFELSLERLVKLSNEQIIVSNLDHLFLCEEQAKEFSNNVNFKYVLEPIAKNTAVAISLALLTLNDEDIVLVSPSDHLIKKESEFINLVQKAEKLAKDGFIITFGIKANSPETAYGYIEADLESKDEIGAYKVKSFTEKPNVDKALEYLQKGNYFWNAGIFLFQVKTFWQELAKHSPEIYNKVKHLQLLNYKNNIYTLKQSLMKDIPEESIDYALMEKTDKIKVLEADIDWSDLGSFKALMEEFKQEGNIEQENIILKDYFKEENQFLQKGKELHKTSLYIKEAKNNFIKANKKVALVGVENLIVVDTNDALLILNKDKTQDVKNIVNKIKESDDKQEQEVLKGHTTVYRPWGNFTLLTEGIGFKVKKIVVKPKARLSLQKHFHRSEHWVILSGVALVQKGDKKFELYPSESVYIPAGTVHRIENPGNIDLIIIETQVGDYVGEDDILRLEDDYREFFDEIKK